MAHCKTCKNSYSDYYWTHVRTNRHLKCLIKLIQNKKKIYGDRWWEYNHNG